MRRVVVTGLGMVSPLGGDVETTWKNIIASKSGAATITRFDPTDYKCRITCEVKPKEHEYGFDPCLEVDHKIQRQFDLFIVFGIAAASEAPRPLHRRTSSSTSSGSASTSHPPHLLFSPSARALSPGQAPVW